MMRGGLRPPLVAPSFVWLAAPTWSRADMVSHTTLTIHGVLDRMLSGPPNYPPSMDSALYSRLVEALRLCALPYVRQAEALPEFVFVPDEVVDEFDQAFRSVTDRAFLSSDAGRSVSQVDRLFAEMTEAKDREWVWSIEAMQQDARGRGFGY